MLVVFWKTKRMVTVFWIRVPNCDVFFAIYSGMNNEIAKWGSALPWWLPLLTSVIADRLADRWWLCRDGRIVEQCSPSYTIHTYTKHIYVVTFTHCISLAKRPKHCNEKKIIIFNSHDHIWLRHRYILSLSFSWNYEQFLKNHEHFFKTVNIFQIREHFYRFPYIF